MSIDKTDVAQAELEALRAELRTRAQTEGTTFGAALTAIAAIGAVALGKQGGRMETLLVLPLVLSGLGLLLVQSSQGTKRIAEYIREHLWKRLPQSGQGPNRSWEHYLEEFRRANSRRPSVYLFTGAIPAFLIFIVPSIAALAITHHEATSPLFPLWWTGSAAVAVFALLAYVSMGRFHRTKPERPVEETGASRDVHAP
jgi:hypothetical protein